MPGLSINKSQENYLRTVHLETIGQERGSSEPIKLDEIEQGLLDLAIFFKTTAAKELEVKNAIDTAALEESIQFDKVQFAGTIYSVDINVLDYYKWVNKGVKGLDGVIDSPFAFRNKFVSKLFAQAIRKWLIRHALKATTRPARKNPLGAEKKAKPFQNVEKTNALAYAVAGSIKKKGLKPTGFWDKAEQETAKQVEKTLGNSFAIAIVNEIAR